MPTSFEDRLREAAIQPSRTQVEGLASAVDRIVEAKRPPAVGDLVTRIRLAFRLPVTDAQLDGFLGQLNRGETAVVKSSSDRQLISLLAACTLIGRFAKRDSLRATAAIPALTIASLAVRTLDSSGAEAVHPDLVSFASSWLDFQGRQLREAGTQSPPRVPARATATENQSEVELHGAEISVLFGYSNDLAGWLESSAGSAGVAVLREQSLVLWWLNAGALDVEPTKLAFQSALELAAMTLSPPPPSRRELLQRRLAEHGEAKIDPNIFEEMRAANPNLIRDATGIGDLVPLLHKGAWDQMPALALASSLYEEMMLARLFRQVFDQEARQTSEAAEPTSPPVQEGGKE
jgi:hypothetical protein